MNHAPAECEELRVHLEERADVRQTHRAMLPNRHSVIAEVLVTGRRRED